jgi:hypothetical protein
MTRRNRGRTPPLVERYVFVAHTLPIISREATIRRAVEAGALTPSEAQQLTEADTLQRNDQRADLGMAVRRSLTLQYELCEALPLTVS